MNIAMLAETGLTGMIGKSGVVKLVWAIRNMLQCIYGSGRRLSGV
jgi:hypothetical protein